MKWITYKAEYYTWLVEVLTTKKSSNCLKIRQCLCIPELLILPQLQLWNLPDLLVRTDTIFKVDWTHSCGPFQEDVFDCPKELVSFFWTRFDESELCWKFLHVFSEVAWYKKWLRLSVQSTNCALPDTFRQKFRHQFSNFSSLFRAAAASIIVKLIMIHHKKENLCTSKIRPTVVNSTNYVFVERFPELLQNT